MRVDIIHNDDTSSASDTDIESEYTTIEVYQIPNEISESYIHTIYIEYDEINIIRFLKFVILIVTIPPIPILDIYYAYKYEIYLDKFAFNINVSIKNCLLISGIISCIMVSFVLPSLFLLSSKRIIKKIIPCIITCIYIISILFITIWYFIQVLVLLGIGLNHNIYGSDYTIVTYLIITSILKLAFAISGNYILYFKGY